MAYVEDFIFYHEQLLQGELTPLLKNEIEQALNAAQALQQEAGMTNTQDYSGLELRVQRIDEHWKQIFCDPRTKALTFYKIASFRETLACKLCEDYLGISFEVPPTTVRLAQRQVYDSAAAELMLDAGHVQLRLSLIIARDGAPGNDINFLVAQGDCIRLASLLIGDRKLLKQVTTPSYQSRVAHSIGKVEQACFTRLESASDFVTNPKAWNFASQSGTSAEGGFSVPATFGGPSSPFQ